MEGTRITSFHAYIRRGEYSALLNTSNLLERADFFPFIVDNRKIHARSTVPYPIIFLALENIPPDISEYLIFQKVEYRQRDKHLNNCDIRKKDLIKFPYFPSNFPFQFLSRVIIYHVDLHTIRSRD